MLTSDDQGRRRSLWRQEFVASLKLGWPLILGNFAQNMLTLVDLVLLGWIGPKALAAGALATSFYFACFIFGIGLTAAVAALLAEEFGRKRHSVRDARRTVRQGLWVVVSITLPMWLLLWNAESALLLLGQEPDIAHEAGRYLRTLQWAVLPGLGFLVLRNFLAARERPGWAGVPAVRSGRLHEVKSSIILQPGPAALTDGVRAIHALVRDWALSAPGR